MPSSEKKVLIVTYYWPPLAGSGVQRWLKFVKYLPQLGWKPYVFTPENPSFDLRDESLLKDVPAEAQVIRIPIWEPYETFFKIARLFGKKKTEKQSELVKKGNLSLFERISAWARGNLIIPDPRKFWVKPSVKFLAEFLLRNNIDIVITTGPPHSMHLIGYNLKKKIPTLRWVADFRDPWSEWGLLDSLMVGGLARRAHKRLEFKVLSTADIVTTITPFYVRHFERLGKRKVELLTNGFDEDDFRNLRITWPEKFVIRHAGIVNEKCDPRPFMQVLKEIAKDIPQFKDVLTMEFVGEVNSSFKNYVQEDQLLNSFTLFTPTIPHKQLIPLYGSSSLLLLILTGYKDAEGYMPGKLFEYMATGLPILGVGPANGDAANMLNATGAGRMIDEKEGLEIKNFLLSIFSKWKNQDLAADLQANEVYSRRHITGQLVQLLENRD